jgi:HAD superfamily hydrolase (TIGR01509 family)
VDAGSSGKMDAAASRLAVASEFGLNMDQYIHAIRASEVRNAPLFTYIEQLRLQYKTALLSNIVKGGLAVRFTEEEQTHYFDAVVASSDIGFAKPTVEAYEITADMLRVRCDECVMIDDRQDYCDGATAAGMQAILYTSFPDFRSKLMWLLAS